MPKRTNKESNIAEEYRGIPKLHSFSYTIKRGHGKGRRKMKYVTSYKYPEVKISSFDDFRDFFKESGWYLNGNKVSPGSYSGKGMVFHPAEAADESVLSAELGCSLTVQEMDSIANHRIVRKNIKEDNIQYTLYLKIDELPGWRE